MWIKSFDVRTIAALWQYQQNRSFAKGGTYTILIALILERNYIGIT